MHTEMETGDLGVLGQPASKSQINKQIRIYAYKTNVEVITSTF